MYQNIKLAILFILLQLPIGLSAQTIEMIEIDPGPYYGLSQGEGLNPAIGFDNKLFFFADSTGKAGLWKTDGTTAGTSFVKDLHVRPEPGNQMVILNGQLFIGASGENRGTQLWKSDGTTTGTVPLTDTSVVNPTNLYVFKDKVFFSASDPTHGAELWCSDGSAAGTYMVRDINTNDNGLPFHTLDVVWTDSTYVYFRACSSGTVHGLWKSDGTEAGTTLVHNGVHNTHLETLYACQYNGKLFIPLGDAAGEELWITDGTPAGTVMVKDILPGYIGSDIEELTECNGFVFFSASNGAGHRDLWRTDGTDSGTVKVSNNLQDPENFFVFKNKLVFSAENATNGRELWISNGVSTGTHMLKNIAVSGVSSDPVDFLEFKNNLYFIADDGVNGKAIWKSDGTTQGTSILKNIIPPGVPMPSRFYKIVECDSLFYFMADDRANNYFNTEIWASDGTTAGTYAVTNLAHPPLADVDIKYTYWLNNSIYFDPVTYNHGRELWKMDIGCNAPPTPVAVPVTPIGIRNPDSRAYNIHISPNPATDIVSARLENTLADATITFQLIDVTGKQLKKGEISGMMTEIDVSGFTPGFYLIKFQINSLFITKRFVKL